eukprot:Clim_evm105s88 gene=Clim_evmTU105s88
MSLFRPCIDLHHGVVKQIVGGTLTDNDSSLKTNFVSDQSPESYALRYKEDDLRGGHVIKLGPGNEEAAEKILAAWPDGLQLGGGINPGNARKYVDMGASKVIVTSYLFPDGELSMDRIVEMENVVGKDRLVLDLSCRKRDDKWFVATNRWQTVTSTEVSPATIKQLSEHCSEFLIHAADVEGLCNGVDIELVRMLGTCVELPCTYAGGARNIKDLEMVEEVSHGKVDLTFGSALDIFGGSGVKYEELVAWNKDRTNKTLKTV